MKYIQQAIQLKKELDQLRPLSTDDELRVMQKFRLDWNYHSNRLEGNSLTFGETKALILYHMTANCKPLRDHLEITGHNEAIKWIEEVVKQERPLTESFIRELHQLILKESYEVDAITPTGEPTKKRIQVGQYKTSPNHVQTKTGEIFRFATPTETPALMQELIQWYRTEKDKTEVVPILLAAQFHYKFIRIHPFDDGNGRCARILMNFILMKFDYPPVVIKTEDKANYFAALQQADADIFEPFVEYVAQNLVHSLQIMIRGAKGESIDEADDVDKMVALLEQKIKGIYDKPVTTKSKEVLIALWEDSIEAFSVKFKVACERLSRHYKSVDIEARVDRYLIEDMQKESIRAYFEEGKILEVFFNCNYRLFNRIPFLEFDYYSFIKFKFDETKFLIEGMDRQVLLKKMYNEQLTEAEINMLVAQEIKRHTDFIEQKIEQFKAKKK